MNLTILMQMNSVKKMWSRVASFEVPGFDLNLVCSNGENIWCHQSVLAGASRWISKLLSSQLMFTHDGSLKIEEATLIFPEIEKIDLQRMLCVLYNGYANVTVNAAEDLKRVWKHLGIDIVRLNNKERIEVVNIENVKIPLKNNFSVEENVDPSIHYHDKEPLDERQHINLEESVYATPPNRLKASKTEPNLDQSCYHTPAAASSSGELSFDSEDPSYLTKMQSRGIKRKSTSE